MAVITPVTISVLIRMTFLDKWFIGVAILLTTYACIPSHLDPAKSSGAVKVQDLTVSEDFDSKSTRTVQLTVKVSASSLADERSRINVYNSLPTVGELVCAGMSLAGQDLRLEFRVPTFQTELYVERVNANGVSEIKKLLVNDYISADFLATTPLVSLWQQASSDLDCITGITRAYTNHKGDITIKDKPLM